MGKISKRCRLISRVLLSKDCSVVVIYYGGVIADAFLPDLRETPQCSSLYLYQCDRVWAELENPSSYIYCSASRLCLDFCFTSRRPWPVAESDSWTRTVAWLCKNLRTGKSKARSLRKDCISGSHRPPATAPPGLAFLQCHFVYRLTSLGQEFFLPPVFFFFCMLPCSNTGFKLMEVYCRSF